jgi:hypothetical protein
MRAISIPTWRRSEEHRGLTVPCDTQKNLRQSRDGLSSEIPLQSQGRLTPLSAQFSLFLTSLSNGSSQLCFKIFHSIANILRKNVCLKDLAFLPCVSHSLNCWVNWPSEELLNLKSFRLYHQAFTISMSSGTHVHKLTFNFTFPTGYHHLTSICWKPAFCSILSNGPWKTKA